MKCAITVIMIIRINGCGGGLCSLSDVVTEGEEEDRETETKLPFKGEDEDTGRGRKLSCFT